MPVPSLASEWHSGSKYNPEKPSPFHLLTRQECNILHCNDTAQETDIFPQLLALREMGQSQGHEYRGTIARQGLVCDISQ